MTLVLTRPQNAVSAVKLGYPVVTSVAEIPNGQRVIRWGNSGETDHRSWPLVLNKRQPLELAINKLAALQSLARVVKTPEIATRRVESGTWILRPENHAEGSDFSTIDGPCNIAEGYHATRLIHPSREYRVWFVRENMLVAKRVPRTSEGQSEDDICRSKWGYKILDEVFPKLAAEVVKARQAIPLDFGAMDVLWKDELCDAQSRTGSEGGKWYFLEVNSAPSLDHARVLEFFKTHLNAILRVVPASEVVQAVPPAENACNRSLARPEAIPGAQVEHSPEGWEARYKAKLMADRRAKEARIYREVFGDV